MSLILNAPASALWCNPWKPATRLSSSRKPANLGRLRVKAFFFNPLEDPIVKEALKEPVAFMGGVFAGLLKLDLNEDPLKEWLTRTVEASGIRKEEISVEGPKADDEPQQIQIE